MRSRTLSLLVFALAALWSAESQAVTIKFCVKHTGVFNDNNNGEDYWTDDNPKPAIGAAATLSKTGVGQLWAGNLGDGLGVGDPGQGCVTWTTSQPNGTYSIQVSSWGNVDSSPIESWNGMFPSQGQWVMYSVVGSKTIADGGVAGQYDVVPNIALDSIPWKVFNQYLIAAYHVYRSAGSGVHGLFKVVVSNSAGGYSTDQNVYLTNQLPNKPPANWWKYKFLAGHEIGHRFAHLAFGPTMYEAQDYDVYDPLCPCDVVANGAWDSNNDGIEDGDDLPTHGIRSEEFVASAVGEGFSHFFAANAWNDTSQLGCSFQYYEPVCSIPGTPPSGCSSTVDCESASGLFLRRLMQTRSCTPVGQVGNYTGAGNELDWLRAYWDLRTNPHADGSPSLQTIVTWIANAAGGPGGWNSLSAYDVLNARAQLEPNNLKDLWNSTKLDDDVCGGDCNGLEP